MLFDISLPIFSVTSLKQHVDCGILQFVTISGVKSSWTSLYID